MATIKVFDAFGERVLRCFDTLDSVAYVTGFEDSTEELPDFQIEEEKSTN